jgi:hypothetical protein
MDPSSLFQLTPVENCVDLGYVRLVVDDLSSDFDPRMGSKGHLLGSDDHLGWNSVVP